MAGVTCPGIHVGLETTELIDHPARGLVGATLRWKRYRHWTAPWPSGQCELCGARFTEGGAAGLSSGYSGLSSGYSVLSGGPAGQDDYYWICAVCYEIRREHFCWTVLDTRGEARNQPDLLGTVLDLLAWPEPAGMDGAREGAADAAPPLHVP